VAIDLQPAASATVTTPGPREIRIDREFAAPRERVWAALTDPGLIPAWWGPRGSETVVDRMDVRRGGAWRFVGAGCGEGPATGFRGTYREVTAPERIVQTFEWEGMPGHVSVETATLEDLGERTRLTTVSVFHTTEERDGMLASGMERGMRETYARLDELLARGAAAAEPVVGPGERAGEEGYVDLYLLPVPAATLDTYRDQAVAFGTIVKEHGALGYREFRGDDLGERFAVGDGRLLTAAVAEFRSRAHRDEVMGRVMADPRVAALMAADPLADMDELRYGGFATFVNP
jgi:uncharacterized protein YndB with AHSA1/START domain/uncharacterized protein YbaA (DUF1428 family)